MKLAAFFTIALVFAASTNGKQLTKRWLSLPKPQSLNVLSGVNDIVGSVQDKTEGVLASATENIGLDISGAITGNVAGIATDLQGTLENAQEEAFSSVEDSLAGIQESVAGSLSDISASVEGAVGETLDFVSDATTEVQAAVTDAVGAVAGQVETQLAFVTDSLSGVVDLAVSQVGRIINNVKIAVNLKIAVAVKLLLSIVDVVGEALQLLGGGIKKVVEYIIIGMRLKLKLAQEAIQIAKDLVATAHAEILAVLDNVSTALTGAIEGITDGIGEKVAAVTKSSAVSTALGFFGTVLQKKIEIIHDIEATKLGLTVTAIDTVLCTLESVLDTAEVSVFNSIEGIITNITDKIL